MKKFFAGFCAAAIAAAQKQRTSSPLMRQQATMLSLSVVLTERATQRYLAILQAVSSSNAQAQRLFSM